MYMCAQTTRWWAAGARELSCTIFGMTSRAYTHILIRPETNASPKKKEFEQFQFNLISQCKSISWTIMSKVLLHLLLLTLVIVCDVGVGVAGLCVVCSKKATNDCKTSKQSRIFYLFPNPFSSISRSRLICTWCCSLSVFIYPSVPYRNEYVSRFSYSCTQMWNGEIIRNE